MPEEDEHWAMGASTEEDRKPRMIVVANQLPVRVRPAEAADGEDRVIGGLAFEWDEDALLGQAKEGVPDEFETFFAGTLGVEIDLADQEKVSQLLHHEFNCLPVFLGKDLREKYYKTFCKQQLWPTLHHVLPISPSASQRFDPGMWQAYIKASKAFCDRILEVLVLEKDYVWIHDYHLLVLPSLLRKRFHRIRCGFFLHSPFPSSEIFRTFPKCEEIVRSMLNADVIGFHTFDYARHFLSCCSRMLGLEHHTNRGSIVVEYYGRKVSIKILPIGVKPQRYLEGFEWPDYKWRRGELLAEYGDRAVMVGIDDMDAFKGIELKIQGMELLLEQHADLVGKCVLVQAINPARSAGAEVRELQAYVKETAERVNRRFGTAEYEPVVLIERALALHERMALFSIAEVAVVTCTRDGMNLLPYEYVVCRQAGRLDDEGSTNEEDGSQPSGGGLEAQKDADLHGQPRSTIVVSEFTGCSPSLSGAFRMNPWSIDKIKESMFAALTMPLRERVLRHQKHWRYVSSHTVSFWAGKIVEEIKKFTMDHLNMRCYGLGLGLDTFRMIALDATFRKLDVMEVMQGYANSSKRMILLDYDGTLVPHSTISMYPSPEVVGIIKSLTEDPKNEVWIISGRKRAQLLTWLKDLPAGLGIASEHGFWHRRPNTTEWIVKDPDMDFTWKDSVEDIVRQYVEATDGSWVEIKDASVVWHYRNADPDFGAWQAKELLDHLESVLQGTPVEVVSGGTSYVETKPAGVSKGKIVERILNDASGGADFVLCIGDDKSDEEMFLALESMAFSPHCMPETFACTVGQKPSKAAYYLNDVKDVLDTLARLATMSDPTREPAPMPTSGSTAELLVQATQGMDLI